MMMFGRPRRQGRRLVDGQLVDDDYFPPGRHKRKIYYGRLLVVVAVLGFLIGTNPANRPFLNRSKHAWMKSNNTRRQTQRNQQQHLKQQQQQQVDWRDAWERLSRAYQILVSEDDDNDGGDNRNNNPLYDATTVNYLLFSVIETKKRHLQVMGAGHTYHCKVTHSYTCRKLRNILLPTSPVRRSNKKQEQLEQLLVLEPLHKRRYFIAYRILLGLVLSTFLVTFIMPPPLSGNNDAVLAEALTQGFWPNPYTPVSSALVTFVDLWLFLAPALAVMDSLISNQSPKSVFVIFNNNTLGENNHHDWNYLFSVVVFLLAASSANLVVMTNWSELLLGTNQHSRGGSSSNHLPRLGYSSDVWAACALGYLRACKDPHYSFLMSTNDWQGVRVSVAIWVRVAVQLLVVSGFSFSSVGLWLTADALGYFIGDYQVQHHFVNQLVDNLWQGVDRFFTSIFGPV